MAAKTETYGPDLMRMAERSILLQVLDQVWKDHLLSLDHLRQGISLRAYAQRDPLNEYKREAFELFEEMLVHLREAVIQLLSHIEVRMQEPEPQPPAFPTGMQETRFDPALSEVAEDGSAEPRPLPRHTAVAAIASIDPADPATWGKVNRNASCPCGSGKKYKHCHGRL